MRHFRERLLNDGIEVVYRDIDDLKDRSEGGDSTVFGASLLDVVRDLQPDEMVTVCPGSHRRLEEMREVANECDLELDIRPDEHFLCPLDWFEDYRRDRKSLRQEYFYREMRRMHDVLMEGDSPVGGEWNYDKKNRESFGPGGPPEIRRPRSFGPDDVTADVLRLVEATFPEHPGSLAEFDWTVTRTEALAALDDFTGNRLADFGTYQDAMWTDEPFLFHSRLSAALNLKLLRPAEVIRAAEDAWEAGEAPLNAVEGFVRQILGWREYVRGVYWSYMPEYLEMNELGAELDLPWFYWTGQTEMNCLARCIGQTLQYGYAHHIQRLMVTGLFALLLGVRPQAVHRWYLAVYVDALEWVELPNTLGMSQFGDGGLMASKPYAASGKYINRMSNYCDDCPYDPAQRTGEEACPFTTLYWDFLIRNAERLEENPRMGLQLRNAERLDADEKKAIRDSASDIKSQLSG
jgi:deoxyribodipyrimidine photolyase-related protein